MKVDSRTIMITDPCYIIDNQEDYCDTNYRKDLYLLGFSDYISEHTIYGDWSCATFAGKDFNIPIGLFCADSGQVCVIFVDELLEYNPEFFNNYSTYTYTVISNFTGNIEYEITEDGHAQIVGYISGGKYFETRQIGC